MGRPTVTAVRRRSLGARRAAARRSLAASGILPTYDLLYGSQCGLLFEQQSHEAGYRETDGAWWPTEERALHAEGAIFREGTHGAVYRLADGTLVHVHLDADSIRISVAGPTRAACATAVAAFRGLYPASFVNTQGDGRVPVTFWSNSKHGPQPRLRRIEASPWEPIVGNYTAEVRDELAALMAWDEPGNGSEGQLLLWQGPPGTGKTWALRALACEWARWAEFHYITDPDSFFVDDPSYMVNVLLSDSYSVVDAPSGEVFEEQAEGKWRVLILEDTGELLSANAKEKYGQGLSRLLNVVDGMIGQGLRVLCLVTTNDELGELNEAVRRPGRCASQIVFGPLSDEEAQAWTGTPDATAGTIAELYSRYGRADAEARNAAFAEDEEALAAAADVIAIPGTDVAIPRKAFEDAVAMARAAKADDVRAEIARVAEAHQAEAEGYGDAAWDEATATVLYVAGDWTDVGPIEEDMLEIDGVEGFAYEMEARPDGWCDAEVVYGRPYASWCEEAALDGVVELALEPLEVEEPPVTAAAPAAPEAPPVPDDRAVALGLLEVVGRFAEQAPAAPPVFNLHFPQHLGVTLERQDVTVPVTVEPAPVSFEVQPAPVENHVHVPEQAPPGVTVLAADPAPVVVEFHAPEQPAPAAPAPARPSSVRVDFDERGHKVYVPVYDLEEATS